MLERLILLLVIADGGPNSRSKLVSSDLRSTLLHGPSGKCSLPAVHKCKYELVM